MTAIEIWICPLDPIRWFLIGRRGNKEKTQSNQKPRYMLIKPDNSFPAPNLAIHLILYCEYWSQLVWTPCKQWIDSFFPLWEIPECGPSGSHVEPSRIPSCPSQLFDMHVGHKRQQIVRKPRHEHLDNTQRSLLFSLTEHRFYSFVYFPVPSQKHLVEYEWT